MSEKFQMDVTNDGVEQLIYLLTMLVATVNPKVDRAETYNLLMDMVDAGFGEEEAITYGELIKSTAEHPAQRH